MWMSYAHKIDGREACRCLITRSQPSLGQLRYEKIERIQHNFLVCDHGSRDDGNVGYLLCLCIMKLTFDRNAFDIQKIVSSFVDNFVHRSIQVNLALDPFNCLLSWQMLLSEWGSLRGHYGWPDLIWMLHFNGGMLFQESLVAESFSPSDFLSDCQFPNFDAKPGIIFSVLDSYNGPW